MPNQGTFLGENLKPTALFTIYQGGAQDPHGRGGTLTFGAKAIRKTLASRFDILRQKKEWARPGLEPAHQFAKSNLDFAKRPN